MKKTIYLAGKVPKSDSENFIDWRIECKKILGKEFNFSSPLTNRAKETDSKAVFGQCCSQIKKADIILINASVKLGVGTAQEMLIANYFKKLVITVIPKNTHHRKENIFLTGKEISDWIHPFIKECSDRIVESFDEAKKELAYPIKKNKDITILDKAAEYFEGK